MALTLNSPAFKPNTRIPKQFSRDGGNVSPPIEWQGAPPGTRSYALVVEDPDAPKGTFRHWAAYDIPPDAQRLAEGAGSGELGKAMQMAKNDFGNSHYDGPQPPPGHGTHHYHFRLFALDVPELDLPEDSDAGQVLEAARAHSLAEAEAVGTFERA
jgi:Raf kinase inhibitor-like YbhB/YbcL family protein